MPTTPSALPLDSTVSITYKPKSLVKEHYISLGQTIWIVTTPYEPLVHATYTPVDFKPRDSYYNLDSASWVGGDSYKGIISGPRPSGTDPNDPISIARYDMRWRSSSTTGNGWEHTFELTGNVALLNTITAGRQLKLCVREFVDAAPDGEGYTQRNCINSYSFSCYIKDIGGITTSLETGQETITVTATTPEYLIDKAKLPRLPYLLKQTVDLERSATLALPRTSLGLGFPPDGAGPFTADPFAGFAHFIDEYTTGYNATMVVYPANERHFLNQLSVAYALQELWTNHVFANVGGTFTTLASLFELEITPDAEQYIVAVEHGPGSPHSAALEAIRHGNYRYWWDANCNMHFIPDYCNPGAYTLSAISYGQLLVSRNFAGKFSATPGPPDGYPRVNRAGVTGQWSTANRGPLGGGGAVPPMNYAMNGPNKALYPIGQAVGNGGEEIIFEGYQGINVQNLAQSEYNRASQKTTIQVEDFPYVDWAMSAFQRVVMVNSFDPLGLYNFVNKYFSVESVSVQVDDTGELITCSMGLVEIFNSL